MLSRDHKRVLLRAISELERKILQTQAKEAQISEKIRQKNGVDNLDRFTLATKRVLLEAKREACSAALVKLRSNMAPVRSLPMELLTEIFLIAVAEQEELRKKLHGQSLRLDYHWNEYNEHRMTLRTLTVQEIISHVCQRWRDVSVAVPSLWQKLIFAIYANDENVADPSLNSSLIGRMEVWLNRTKNAPLDVTFWSYRTPVLDIWKVLREVANRIRSLRIYDQNAVVLQEFVSSLPWMPLLETLHLGCKTKNVDTMWKAALRSWPRSSVCPLKELYVERATLPWTQMSLSHLTKLVIMGRRAQIRVAYAALNFVLKSVAPTLQWLVYQDQNKPNLADEPYDSSIEFPVLETMELNIADVRFLIHWLKAFSLPSLTRVYLDIQTETGVEFRSLLTAFTARRDQRPGQKLRTTFQKCEELTMGPCGNATAGIGNFIGTAFPSIRKFHSHPEDAPFPIEEVFTAFHAHCPHLVEIQAYRCYFHELNRLVDARSLNNEVASLLRVSLEDIPPWSHAQIARVREKVEFLLGDEQMQNTDFMEYEEYGGPLVIEDDPLYAAPTFHAQSSYSQVSHPLSGSLDLSDDDAEMTSSSFSSSSDEDGAILPKRR